MLHTKFLGNRSIGSGGEIFKGFYLYGRVTWTIYTNFASPFPRRLHKKKIGFDWPNGFGGEDV